MDASENSAISTPIFGEIETHFTDPLGAGKKSPFARGCRSEQLHQKNRVCFTSSFFFRKSRAV